MATSPTRRSAQHLRDRGYWVARVEHWNAFARRRVDLVGCDLLALKASSPPLLVQTTTRANQAARLAKVRALPEARLWLLAGGRIVIHGWARVGRAGAKVWDVAEREPAGPAPGQGPDAPGPAADLAARMRRLAEKTDDPLVREWLLTLANGEGAVATIPPGEKQ